VTLVPTPSLDVLSKTDERIVLRFDNVPRQYINAIRRISISEVPTLAIDDVVMMENSSVMHDEAIAHRLGLIPLRTDLKRFVMPEDCDCNNSLGCSKCRVLLVLNSEANDKTKLVSSGELVSEDDVVRPVSKDIPIIILAPSQKLKFEAYAKLGLGSSHAKWQPTTCSIVTDGTEQNQSILTIETTGALTAEETTIAAIQKLNTKIKDFSNTIASLQVPRTE
jgi:DNA-directed RNA polymerase subunit D